MIDLSDARRFPMQRVDRDMLRGALRTKKIGSVLHEADLSTYALKRLESSLGGRV